MSNFNENENKSESASNAQAETVNENDGFSTIFSTPAEHKKKKPSKQKRSRIGIAVISLVAVAALVGGTVAVVKLIPKKEEDTSSSPVQSISVLDLKSDDFDKVTVTNQKGVFKLYSKIEKSESASSATSSTSDVTNWYLEGYDAELLNTTSISNIADGAASIDATREITTKTAAECGLENPVTKVDVATKDGAEFSILFGSVSPDNTGTYLKLSTSDKIYIVGDSVADNFDFELLSLANTDSIPGITPTSEMSAYKDDNGALSKFDSLTVTGKNFPEKMVFVPNSDASISQFAAYVTSSPSNRIADKVEDLFTIFSSGVTVSGAYSLDVSSTTLASLGLNEPDFAATMKILNNEYTFKFKLQEDGSYAVVCNDSKMVKKVDASSLKFIGYGTNDFYASWVCMQSISDLSNFTIKAADKTYSFDIKAAEKEDSENRFNITTNGTELSSEYFQDFYKYCISLTCADYTVQSVSGQPDLSMTFTYTDTSRAPSTVEFRKVSETRYQYSVDGIDMGKITSSAFNKLEKYAAKVAAGDSIN